VELILQFGQSKPEVMQQNAVQKAIAPIMGKKVWHVYEVSSIFLSAHERNRVVN